MNPHTNRFERLSVAEDPDIEAMRRQLLARTEQMLAEGAALRGSLVRPDGSPVPTTWSVFTEGEEVVIKDYTFRLVRIGESYAVIEPVGPVLIGERK